MPPTITNTIMLQNVARLIYSHHIFLLKGERHFLTERRATEMNSPRVVSHRGFERRLRGWGAWGVSPFKGNNAVFSILFHNKSLVQRGA